MLKRCISCCGEDENDEPDPKRPVAPLKPQPRNSWETPGRVTPRRDAVLQFAGSRWLVNRSADHGGKLYWTNIDTKQTTWRQPLPPTREAPANIGLHESMRRQVLIAANQSFCGAPADPDDPGARTGISGVPPDEDRLRGTMLLLAQEHILYPLAFLEAIGLRHILFCEQLHYNGQRRRDVPDLASGTLYVDVGDRPRRRKRHSFHHELWHMVDYHLLGNTFESFDAVWSKCNPPNFKYGRGGKHMRDDSKSSQLSSAPSEAFLNRYSTSSIAEDKAEVWACAMCYEQILKSVALQRKAAVLRARAQEVCGEMDAAWWERVRAAQKTHIDFWEQHHTHDEPPQTYWCNWLTGEKQWETPDEVGK